MMKNKKIILAILLIISFFSNIGYSKNLLEYKLQDKQKIKEYLKKAKNAYNNGDYISAYQYYYKVYKIDSIDDFLKFNAFEAYMLGR